MKTICLFLALFSTYLPGYVDARVTSPYPANTSPDRFCVGPKSNEVCVDFNGHFVPTTNNTQNLGSTSLKWQNAYIGNIAANVGVGNTNPLYALDIVGAVNLTGQLIVGGTVTVTGNAFSVGTSTIVATNGQVGIGTSSPNTALQVVGTSSSRAIIVNSPNPALAAGSGNTDAEIALFATQYSSTAASMLDLLSYSTSSANPLFRISNHWENSGGASSSGTIAIGSYVGSTFTDVLAITTQTRVGIGTITPASTFDVSGGVSIGSYAGTNAAPSNGLIISGNVGFGTTNPSQDNLVMGPGTNIRIAGGNVILGNSVIPTTQSVELFYSSSGSNQGCSTTCGAQGVCIGSWTSGGTNQTCATAGTNNRCLCAGFLQ